ncbi:protein BREAST CANCER SUSCEPTIBILITY 2 homolog A-like [Argentina anserina]|uniref:protein BREAST CANCER SUSCEPTIBILITY 2 homolog A-like n=1 Tax=Argentina anserina TaxID=57926 RepID=UPI00217664E3|nr:protein BREAST CANCER SUSCEPTIBILITY 2 homolog A-like [Potentilla anserina]
MSTWHLFPDAGENFRWRISGPGPNAPPPDAAFYPDNEDPSSSNRLPSMADLLLQGCSKLAVESQMNHGGGVAMFRSGLGRSVSVKPSSLAKAASLLASDSGRIRGSEGEIRGGGFGDSLFQTASGKAVNISSKGLVKAKKLLSLGDESEDCDLLSGSSGGEVKEAVSVSRSSVNYMNGSADSGITNVSSLSSKQAEVCSAAHTPSSVKLCTSGGRSNSVSSDGCKAGSLQTGFENEFNQSYMKSEVTPSSVQLDTLSGRTVSVSNNAHKTGSVQSRFKNESKLNHIQSKMPSSVCTPSPGGSFDSLSTDAHKTDSGQSGVTYDTDLSFIQSHKPNLAPKPPSIKFNTAGGRSISVSTDALQRARSLLGDPDLGTLLNEGYSDADLTFLKGREHESRTASSHQKIPKTKFLTKSFVSPLQSSSDQVRTSAVKSDSTNWGTNLISQFDVVSNENARSELSCGKRPFSNTPCALTTVENNNLANGTVERINHVERSLAKPLVDISNTIGTTSLSNIQMAGVKRRLGGNSISSFKKPRISNFSTPLHRDIPIVPKGLPTFPSNHSSFKVRVSTRYPVLAARMSMKKYFGMPPSDQTTVDCISDQVRRVTATNAEDYMFPKESGLNYIGAEAVFRMLASSGASTQNTSREWVINHYKWIVWKLACYERNYPTKALGKFLTLPNVLEELKYRYEREVNHGHRSAIKKILEGDASASSMLVLCISAIRSKHDPNINTSSGAGNSSGAKVELTDGWYSVDAILDALLSKQLASGKLFVGQKLRIWGAGLCGWVGPISPLEVSREVILRLHINGTYRAHWDDRLGFCNQVGSPLAFKCIKTDGGLVPWTLIGIKRIYPVLYKERLSNGRSVVRSERLETKMMQSHCQRRSNVIEGIISEFQRGLEHSQTCNERDSEGAKLLRMLETAAEPEVLMAEMSTEQLNSFTKYRAKLEAIKQSDMEKSIMKALEDAGLAEREVMPLMRVRVVGLTRNIYEGKDSPKEGLITIWNPSEKQKSELVEGQAYTVSDLIPTSPSADILYLLARGSKTKWKPLSQQATDHFRPFFSPRKSILLSDFGQIPLSSDFDIAAFVVFVGDVYTAGHQKKQWVFVTDGSISVSKSEELNNSLLAICFCSPHIDDQPDAPINYNLTGSTVGFCNLIKRAKDQVNALWVAEATENSGYFLCFDSRHCSHLKGAAASAERWGRISSLKINRLKERVLCIIGKG